MTVICDECWVKVPTDRILELHKNKRHSGGKGEKKTVIKPKDVKAKKQDSVKIEPEIPEGSLTPVPSGMVRLVSADKRILEVAIGSQSWSGIEIDIPEELENEIRRLLENGGFFLKD